MLIIFEEVVDYFFLGGVVYLRSLPAQRVAGSIDP